MTSKVGIAENVFYHIDDNYKITDNMQNRQNPYYIRPYGAEGVEISEKLKTNLSFKDLICFSTHNSLIIGRQVHGQVSLEPLGIYLPFLQYFPICFEIDIDPSSHKDYILIGHISKKKLDFSVFLKYLSDLYKIIVDYGKLLYPEKLLYPLILSFDISKIQSNTTKCTEILNKVIELLDADDVLQNYILRTVELDTKLTSLMNKILLRWGHEQPPATITSKMGSSICLPQHNGGMVTDCLAKSFSSATCNVSKEDMIKDISKQLTITYQKDKFMRAYPNACCVSLVGSVTAGLTGSKNNTQDYKTLNSTLSDIVFYNHGINCMAFNIHDIDPTKLGILLIKFYKLYQQKEFSKYFYILMNKDEIKFNKEWLMVIDAELHSSHTGLTGLNDFEEVPFMMGGTRKNYAKKKKSKKKKNKYKKSKKNSKRKYKYKKNKKKVKKK